MPDTPAPKSPAPQALIFNIQRFCLHDGPGIRSTVFFKGCPLRCAWCQNPESLRSRAELAFYADRCRSTADCVRACPRDALRLDGQRVDRERCDACGECVGACPFGALQVVGRRISLDDLLRELLRDEPFYRATGGGLTLSGGEATLQLEFVAALARCCRQAGVGVGLQTCGLFRWEAFEPHLPRFEFIHYDLKVMDPDRHRGLTGGDNHTILANARRLVDAGAAVSFRMPLVPGLTDGEANVRSVAAFLRGLDVKAIHLLPYHAMGAVKNARIGAPLAPLELPEGRPGESGLERTMELFRTEGIAARCFEPC